MAPGMAHCGGGEGPNDFDELTALEQWVENGKAPDMIPASHTRDGKVDRTRPLCAVSAGRELQGQRQHRRGRELRLQITKATKITKGTKTMKSVLTATRFTVFVCFVFIAVFVFPVRSASARAPASRSPR